MKRVGWKNLKDKMYRKNMRCFRHVLGTLGSKIPKQMEGIQEAGRCPDGDHDEGGRMVLKKGWN